MTEKFPVARYLYIGKQILGYTEKEVWRMTFRKLELLYVEHLKANGLYKEAQSIDDIFD